MNIFATNDDPRISAVALDDKRLIKMILETTQMLSTAMHVLGIPGAPYKITHQNHPCSVWVRATWNNFRWTTVHLDELICEYHRRYGKVHKCADYLVLFSLANDSVPKGPLTPFANCSRFKDIETVLAYRLTMICKWIEDEEKKRKAKWTNSTPPLWWLP